MMKIKLTALLLCLLMLTGCAGGEGTYYTSKPHNEKEPVPLEASGAEDITGYYSLKGALLKMVSMGVAEDILRIGRYSGDLDDDLSTIIREITTVEPIGIYGVSSISAEQSRVLSYREIAVQIQYKRDPSEMQDMITVSSPYDLENRMTEMFMSFSEGEAYYIKDTSNHPEDVEKQLYAAWMRCGSSAVGLNSSSAELFKGEDEGESCVIKVSAYYEYSPEELAELAAFVDKAAAAACTEYEGQSTAAKLDRINSYLNTYARYDASARRVVNETEAKQPKTSIYTAYGVFADGVGAQSGFALAASAMCDALGIEHTVETGYVNGDIYSWLSLTIDEAEYIFDPTAFQSGRDVYLYRRDAAGDMFAAW